MTKDEQHCTHAATLTGIEKIVYMREHGIRLEQVWAWEQRHKNTRQTRAKKKQKRVQTLIQQGGQCALCEIFTTHDGTNATHARWCLDKSGKVVCNSCNLFLTRYRKLRAGGVECEDMEVFIE